MQSVNLMSVNLTSLWPCSVAVVAVCALVVSASVQAQVRGVYPLGMSATNSGSTPESGFTYANSFLFYSRDSLRGSHGEVLASGQNSVMMDMNSLFWVSRQKLCWLGGAKFSLSATLPVANNSLTSDVQGALTGGGGFADSYYQPFILGWQTKRADIRAVYGFLAPTGRFKADATDNVGSGYWTHVAAAGATFYLTQNKGTALSAFQLYEFHGMQRSTDIHPGQTLSLDYSLTHIVALRNDSSLQLGLVGYAQWQTTDKSGPTITTAQAKAHYRVNALGFTSNVILPARKVSVGVKYFKEFSNKSTFQGYSLQISGAISF
jgi:hypothetical protein